MTGNHLTTVYPTVPRVYQPWLCVHDSWAGFHFSDMLKCLCHTAYPSCSPGKWFPSISHSLYPLKMCKAMLNPASEYYFCQDAKKKKKSLFHSILFWNLFKQLVLMTFLLHWHKMSLPSVLFPIPFLITCFILVLYESLNIADDFVNPPESLQGNLRTRFSIITLSSFICQQKGMSSNLSVHYLRPYRSIPRDKVTFGFFQR